jgi:poly-gamma-glutamate biosynthesis protein PgsC/CapC
VRFAFLLGIAVSMVMYEKRHLTTGSIVVPGYIAVFVLQPLVIVATFANAFVTYAFVNHLLRRYVLLYGRTKFTILAITSTVIQMVMMQVSPTVSWLWKSDVPLFVGVGYIVPALIAHDMARQGIRKTTTSVLAAGVVVATPIALAIFLRVPGVNELAPIEGYGSIAIDGRWIPFAMALAVVGSWAVAHNHGLRSGGFVGAAFAGMFMGNPLQVVIALAVAAITWLFVTRVLMRHMILFGRRKFSTMLIVSSMLSWWSLWIGNHLFGSTWQQNFGVGSLALTPLLLPGLLANDAQRTSPKKVVTGLALVASFTVSTTWWVQTTFETSTLDVGWKLVSAATATILFWPQLRALNRRIVALFTVDRLRIAALLDRVRSVVRPAPTPAFTAPRLAAALPSAPDLAFTAAEAPVPASTWEIWRLRHPDIAAAAERWIDDQLHPVRRPAPARSDGHLDRTTISMLAASLRSMRDPHTFGDRSGRVRPLRRSPLDPNHLVETSSGTAVAQREAHPAAPAVPDITIAPRHVQEVGT